MNRQPVNELAGWRGAKRNKGKWVIMRNKNDIANIVSDILYLIGCCCCRCCCYGNIDPYQKILRRGNYPIKQKCTESADNKLNDRNEGKCIASYLFGWPPSPRRPASFGLPSPSWICGTERWIALSALNCYSCVIAPKAHLTPWGDSTADSRCQCRLESKDTTEWVPSLETPCQASAAATLSRC